MSDPVSMSLDDYIKSQKKTGKMNYGRNRRGPKPNSAGPRGGGGGGAAGQFRGGQNSFRGRNKGRQANNNGQGRWNNRATPRNRGQFAGANNSRGNFQQRFSGGGGAVVGGQNNRRLSAKKQSRNTNRQQRRQRNSFNRVPQAGAVAGPSKQRYFNNRQFNSLQSLGAAAGTPKRRNLPRRLRLQKKLATGGIAAIGQQNIVVGNRNTKRAVMKLAKKRVQRAKLLVSRKKTATGPGKMKKIIAATSTGRLALVKNGFVTVKNTKAKKMERALVQMKIARAQQARNRISPQRNNLAIPTPGPSGGGRKRPARKPAGVRPGRALDWNTSIVRTMTNDMADEMTSSQLNPDIQRKIAFIQSRSKNERAPVMPDFKAPVTTSRMKLSDRFRLLRDQ